MIGFPAQRPQDWPQFSDGDTLLYLTAGDFDDVSHLIQSESPVFFTALTLFGLRTGAVRTQLDLSDGDVPGEGDRDLQTLEALIRKAPRENPALAPARKSRRPRGTARRH